VILVVALIFFTCANAFEFTNLLEVKELRKSNYGNSLIETISLQLQNSGKIEEVQKLLTELLYKLNKDQDDADSEWAKKKGELEDHRDLLIQEIEDLRVKIVGIETRLAELQILIDDSERNIKQYETQHAENRATLDKLAENRAKDKAEYGRSVEEHNDLINAIEQVIAELETLKGHVSGKDRPSHVEEIAQETRDREYLTASFLQVTKDKKTAQNFAQIAAKADQAGLAALIRLLNDLLESTKASRNADEQHEQDSIAAEATLSATLLEDNKALEALLVEQNNHLDKYNGEHEEKTAELAEKKAEKERKETELAAIIQELIDRERQYLADKAERDNERGIIQKLQHIVDKRLANMSSFLRGDAN